MRCDVDGVMHYHPKREYLHHHHFKKAMDSFGAWADRKIPSVVVVNKLRAEESRQ
jgi:hypothetical protein